MNSGHQDRDRSCDDGHEVVRPPRTGSSDAVRAGLLRRSGLWATPSSATTFFLSFLTVQRHRAAIGNPRAGLPRQRCSPCPQKAPPRSPAAPSCITPSPPSLTATSFLTTPLTPFPLSQALGGQFSARRRPRDPPPSRPPGRNPTPVGGAVTCFSSGLHMCRLHVAAHMSAHVRARGATVMRVSVRRCIRTLSRGRRLCSVLAYFRVMM